MKNRIYILHGWTYTVEKWEPVMQGLKKNGYNPVLLKIPGLTAPLDEVWKLEDYVKWLKIILDQEKEKAVLIGHSNGGRISLAFTYKYPEKVEKLILIDSSGIHHNELPLRIKRFVFFILAKAGMIFKKLPVLKKVLYKFAREHDYEKANPMLRKTMRNLIKSDLSHALSFIQVPTAIIWGKGDKTTPVKDGETMHEKIKYSSFHVIPDAKHSPHFTAPEEVVKIIVKELKQ